MPDWKALLRTTYELALQSPDPSTQNGALLVAEDGTISKFEDEQGKLALGGFNRFPPGVVYAPERWVRPVKYKFIEHAERTTIFGHARQGISTKGLTMVCAWATCSDCARAIIEAGITRLVTHKQAGDRSPPSWAEEIAVAFTMLREADVALVLYDGPVDGPEVLHSGVRWTP